MRTDGLGRSAGLALMINIRILNAYNLVSQLIGVLSSVTHYKDYIRAEGDFHKEIYS